tara:strand:- start:303 stop:626 length:324 start_codon:yes stop_codon:yes gene_type:complete
MKTIAPIINNHLYPNLIKLLKPFIIFIGTALLISAIHWLIVNIFIYYCFDVGLVGMVTNFFTLGSPVCQLLNALQHSLASSYIKLWATTAISLTAWSVGIILYNKKN